MTSFDLNSVASQLEDADSTDVTQDDDEIRMAADSTDVTQDDNEATDVTQDDKEGTDVTQDDDEIRMSADYTELTQDRFDIQADADNTEMTQDKFKGIGGATNAHVPASEIIVRDIAVEAAPVAALPADSDAAFSQWLAGSQLARN